MLLIFTCPSCGAKLRGIEPLDSATQVLKRTCRNQECRETWQLVVHALRVKDEVRIDHAAFTFIGRRRAS